jgi:hypothetical protein
MFHVIPSKIATEEVLRMDTAQRRTLGHLPAKNGQLMTKDKDLSLEPGA